MNTAHLSSTKNTSPLAAFADQQIDWNLTPEMAVTLYLEWGRTLWRYGLCAAIPNRRTIW